MMRVVLVTLSLLTMAACDDDAVTDPRGITGRATFEVQQPSLRGVARHVPGTRKAEEEAAIAQLLAKAGTDERIRKEWLELLSGVHGRIGSVSDPEMARLVTTIYEIREADARALQLEESRQIARTHGIVVTAVLMDEMPVAGARAVVLRRVTTHPRNVILLPRGRATPADLSDAIATVFGLREAHGDLPFADARVVVPPRKSPRRARPSVYMEQRLDALTRVPRRTVAGVGDVPAIDIRLGPVKPSK